MKITRNKTDGKVHCPERCAVACNPHDQRDTLRDAVAVVTFDARISLWLKGHDPMAYAQLCQALRSTGEFEHTFAEKTNG